MYLGYSRLALALAAIALAVLPSGARADNGVTPVIVQNPVTLGNPGDVAKTALGLRHPFEFVARQAFADNACVVTAMVPAKQRAVIEYLTGSTVLPAGTPLLAAALSTHTDTSLASPESNPFRDDTGEVVAVHALPIPDHIGVDDGIGGRDVVFAETLRVYADEGTEITISMRTPSRGTNPEVFCFFSMSGQLIDVP